MGGSDKILVVDDGENARRSLSRLLELSGYQTDQAMNGEEAIEKISRDRFSLTLMDVVMPGMGGMEAASRIKAQHSDHPIILMSAFAGHFFTKYGIPEGVTGYLPKPIEPEKLLTEVRKALCNRS